MEGIQILDFYSWREYAMFLFKFHKGLLVVDNVSNHPMNWKK